MADEEKVQPQEVDINALDLSVEEMDIDTDADPFAFPPPVPDGTHRAKLKLGGKWNAYPKKDDETALAYLATSIEARLIADGEPWDNNPVFDNFVSTMIMQSTGTCRIAGVLKAVGVSVPNRTSHQELAQLLSDALASEPIVQITTQWEGYCETCPGRGGKPGATVLKGMNRYPMVEGTDKHKHEIECPKCGTTVRTSARIRKYLLDGV